MLNNDGRVPEVIPLFPLPDVVLFPGQALPLHVFEPRYVEMTRDALAAGGWMGIAVLRPGFEPLYFTRHAPIHSVLGAGRVVSARRGSDGRFNILLHGAVRVRVVEECGDRPYRLARVDLMRCSRPPVGEDLARLRRNLADAGESLLRRGGRLRESLLRLITGCARFDTALDCVCAALPVPAEQRLELLSQTDVSARAALLLDRLRELSESGVRTGVGGVGSPCEMN